MPRPAAPSSSGSAAKPPPTRRRRLVETLQKVAFLLEARVDTWDLTGLNPNRVKWLAQLGWKAPTPQLQRMDPRRRYPILVAFLHQALLHHTDVAVELYDQCLWEYHSAAQQGTQRVPPDHGPLDE